MERGAVIVGPVLALCLPVSGMAQESVGLFLTEGERFAVTSGNAATCEQDTI